MKNVKLTDTAHKQLNHLRDKVLNVETQSDVIDSAYKSMTNEHKAFIEAGNELKKVVAEYNKTILETAIQQRESIEKAVGLIEGNLARLTDVIIPSENISQLHYSKSQNLECPNCGHCDRTCDNCEYCGTN